MPTTAPDDGAARDLVELVYLGLALAMTCITLSVTTLALAWRERDGSRAQQVRNKRDYIQLYPASIKELAENASEEAGRTGGNGADSYARKLLEAEITTLYLRYSTTNMEANEWRAFDRSRIIALLVIAFVALVGTMVPYAALSLSHPPILRIQTI
jgi:hypothetical protein